MPAKRKKLGEILIDAGVLDPMQLQAALGQQRIWGGRLGRVLLDHNFLTESQLVEALAAQMRLERVDLSAVPVDQEALALVPVELAESASVLPVRLENKTLFVAMSDPTNVEAIDNVRFRVGMKVKPYIAGEIELERAIRRFYYGESPGSAMDPQAPAFGGADLTMGADQPPQRPLEPSARFRSDEGSAVGDPPRSGAFAHRSTGDFPQPQPTGSYIGPQSTGSFAGPSAPPPGAAGPDWQSPFDDTASSPGAGPAAGPSLSPFQPSPAQPPKPLTAPADGSTWASPFDMQQDGSASPEDLQQIGKALAAADPKVLRAALYHLVSQGVVSPEQLRALLSEFARG